MARNPPLWADLERVDREAEKVRPAQLALTAVATVLYVIGWLAAKIFIILAIVTRWSIAAVVIGWRDARQDIRRRS